MYFSEIAVTFAGAMKKVGCISMAVLLSIMIVMVGTGIDVVHCSHSGYVQTRLMSITHEDGVDCNAASGCMTVRHLRISPTNMAQTFSHDFHAVQPLILAFNQLFTGADSLATSTTFQYYHKVYTSPPRAYLNIIHILLA